MQRRQKTALFLTTILAMPGASIGGLATAQTIPAAPATELPSPPVAPAEQAQAEAPIEQAQETDAAATPSLRDPAQDGAPLSKSADTSADDLVVATGTRLPTNDPTSDVRVYTAEDIRALGVSNVQDFIRTLPQNQASVGTGLNNRRETEVRFDDGGLGGLGVGGINLRGLGTKNTLVLLNGRRVAGAAGIEEGFANINNIPLAAI